MFQKEELESYGWVLNLNFLYTDFNCGCFPILDQKDVIVRLSKGKEINYLYFDNEQALLKWKIGFGTKSLSILPLLICPHLGQFNDWIMMIISYIKKI